MLLIATASKHISFQFPAFQQIHPVSLLTGVCDGRDCSLCLRQTYPKGSNILSIVPLLRGKHAV